jgi:hypothetical protein
MATCARDVVWAQMYVQEILNGNVRTENQVKATILYSDSTAAIQLAPRRASGARTRHIDIRHHYIRQMIEEGKITLRHLNSDHLPADALTKALGTELFERHRDFLVTVPTAKGRVKDK